MIGPTEWNYLPLSEERIVSQLIHGRSKLESLKGNLDILCTLIDLDRQIEKADLEVDQRELLGRIMEGYSLGDMASITGTNYDSLELRFRNAVYHIVQQNNREWVQIHESKQREDV